MKLICPKCENGAMKWKKKDTLMMCTNCKHEFTVQTWRKEWKKKTARKSCYDCAHVRFCFIFHEMHNTVVSSRFFNIDSNATPGRVGDIFTAVGGCCSEFKLGED